MGSCGGLQLAEDFAGDFPFTMSGDGSVDGGYLVRVASRPRGQSGALADQCGADEVRVFRF